MRSTHRFTISHRLSYTNHPQRAMTYGVSFLLALCLGSVVAFSACDSSQDSESNVTPTLTEDRNSILTSIRHQVIVPMTEDFLAQSQALRDLIAQRDMEGSRAAWFNTMRSWQYLEVLQLGPAGVAGSRIGGEDLRDHIYSFPISNACRAEQEWVAQEFGEEGWGDQAPYQVKGLDALEHILFKTGTDSACPDQARIVRDNLWGNFINESETYTSTRWAYADAIIADIEDRAQMLASNWQGSFGEAFERAESPFSAEQDALNQLFAAIFYVDLSVKDRKLGGPTGVHMSCLEETCPEMIEHRASGFGRAALIANLESFISVLQGTVQRDVESFGLSALLAQEGAAELGSQLEGLAQEAITQLEMSDLTLSEQLETDPEALRQVHAKTREITELLKTQVVTTLNLSVPQEGAGDND